MSNERGKYFVEKGFPYGDPSLRLVSPRSRGKHIYSLARGQYGFATDWSRPDATVFPLSQKRGTVNRRVWRDRQTGDLYMQKGGIIEKVRGGYYAIKRAAHPIKGNGLPR